LARTRESARRLAELEAVAEIMTLAIAREKATADYYTRALGLAGTDGTRKAFALLIEQEKEHEKRIREELEMLRKEISEIRRARSGKR
jgi:rubrerythrin